MSLAQIKERIAKAERSRGALAAEVEELDSKSRMHPDPETRAGLKREYLEASEHLTTLETRIREGYQELETTRDSFRKQLHEASEFISKAQEALLDAECSARDAGETTILAEIERLRKRLVIGLGPLCDEIDRM